MFLRAVRYLTTRLVARQRDIVLASDWTRPGPKAPQTNQQLMLEVARDRRRVEEYLSMVENPATARYYATQYRDGDWVVGARSRVSGEPLGCAFVRTNCSTPTELLSRTGKGAYVYGLYTKVAHRGAGIGPQCLVRAQVGLSSAGFDYVWVKVAQGNASAIRCYAKAGFQRIGRQMRWFVIRREVYSRYEAEHVSQD